MLPACAPLGIKLVEQENVLLKQEKALLEQEKAHLLRGESLLAQGDFEGALRENQEVLARFPQKPPGDAALFNMGLIHVHYANPKKDIGQALILLNRLEKDFPESPRTIEAKIWGSILEAMEKTRRNDIETDSKKREQPEEEENLHLRRGQLLLAQGDFEGALRENQEVLARFPQKPPGDAALFNMGLIHVHYANPKKDIWQALTFFTRLEDEFPESPRTEEARIWIGILEAMEKTRQVDIEIEEKKRELRR
jgi:tetratricopeptide (TPR) repeat protein